MITISASVGDWKKGAKNRSEDIMAVQELLKAAAKKHGRSDYDPKAVDGKIAGPPRTSDTVKAICAFQSRWMNSPDGLISPGYKTIQELSKYEESWFGMDPEEILGKLRSAYETALKRASGGGLVGPCFPLAKVPSLGYQKGSGGRWFGASRKSYYEDDSFRGYRKHAACDLIMRAGTPVYAVDDGEVIFGPAHFYHGTHEIQVRHPKFLARYCEMDKKLAEGVARGKEVKKGQVIGYVGQMYHSAMLHFELYSDTMSGSLTQKNQTPTPTRNEAPYMRRKDLIDPTDYLESWKSNLPS